MDQAQTRYIDREGAALAYQVFGRRDANADAVFMQEIAGHLDLIWTDPYMHAQGERIAARSRMAWLQRRGVGLSEPIGYVPTIEQQADDILAIMDAEGMRRATIGGVLSTCAVAAFLAARDPNRVRNLVLVQPVLAGPLSDSRLEAGWPPDDVHVIEEIRAVGEQWGTGKSLEIWGASVDTPYNRRQFAMMERCSAAPATGQAFIEWVLHTSFIEVFKAIPVPTTLIFVPGALAPTSVAQAGRELMPNAEYIELGAIPPGSSIGEAWQPIWDRMLDMATGTATATDVGRFLGAVLFTDVVDSTRLLTEIGDARYRELHDAHERQVRMQVEGAGGRLVNVIGDGTFSVFDGPSRAVAAAQAICAQAAELGIGVRAGVHSGELERTVGHDVTGLTVHVGARVAAAAEAGQVLVSRTVRDLAIGSGIQFTPHGEHELKGVPGRWELFSVGDERSAHPEAEAPSPTAVDRAALRFAQRTPRLARTAVAAGNAWQKRRAKSG